MKKSLPGIYFMHRCEAQADRGTRGSPDKVIGLRMLLVQFGDREWLSSISDCHPTSQAHRNVGSMQQSRIKPCLTSVRGLEGVMVFEHLIRFVAEEGLDAMGCPKYPERHAEIPDTGNVDVVSDSKRTVGTGSTIGKTLPQPIRLF